MEQAKKAGMTARHQSLGSQSFKLGPGPIRARERLLIVLYLQPQAVPPLFLHQNITHILQNGHTTSLERPLAHHSRPEAAGQDVGIPPPMLSSPHQYEACNRDDIF